MSKSTTINLGGSGLLLTLVLILLKVYNVLQISWWLVFLPIWIGPALAIGFLGAIMAAGIAGLIIFLIICVIIAALDK